MLPKQALWKFGRDNQQILESQRLIMASDGGWPRSVPWRTVR